MRNHTSLDENPGHIAVKQVSTINNDDELKKDAIALNTDDSSGEDSALGGDSPSDDFGDFDPNDPDAGGILDIDRAREAMGERSDGDGEFRNELTDDDLNLNARDDVSTPRADDDNELNAK